MIDIIEILITAVVQGIGEFLPISSSAHISLTQKLFEVFGGFPPIKENDLTKLAVVLHLGTLIPVLVIFWRVLFDMLVKDWTLLFKIVVATIPVAVVGLSVKKMVPDIAENFYIIGSGFIITGFLLLSTLKSPNGETTCKTLGWLDAILIGCVQAVAVLPGISRFGSTTCAGLFRKLEWREAVKFSFLLSIPAVAGTGLLELRKMLKITESTYSNESLLLGFLVSGVFGFLTLSAILRFLPKNAFWCFAIWVFLMSPLAFYLTTLPAPIFLSSDEQHGRNFVQKVCKLGNGIGTDISPSTEDTSKVIQLAYTSISPSTEGVGEERTALDEKLSKEEAQREYEKIAAENEAREEKMIEEEQKRVPFVDHPDKLVLLDEKDRIWIEKETGSVVILGRVALREGLLELFACRVGTKEHESIVAIRVKPFLIHAALLAVEAKEGKPVQFQPTFVPASGDEIEIKIRWEDKDGKVQETHAQDWVWDAAHSKEDAKKPMTTHWVFTGSTQYKDGEGENHYLADVTGELFGVSNFIGAILDVPVKSSADNANLEFACFTERIPPLATPLTIILKPIKNKVRAPEKNTEKEKPR